MAESLTVGILRVLLTANTAEFEQALKGSSKTAKAWSKDLGSMGRQATAVGQTLTTALTLPLAGMAVAASKAAIDFESSFAGIRKTVSATPAEFKVMEQAIRDLSKTIPVNVNELNRLGEAAGALGIPKAEIVDFARVMAQLGVTTNVTSEQAAESIAKIQNIFGAAGKDTENFASTLVHLGNNGASTEAEILEMATRIAGAGNVIGLTQGQVLGFANALASVGLEAEAGGTAISRVFVGMAAAVSGGGKELDQFAKVAGMSADSFTQKFKTDAAGAVLAFIEGLNRIRTSGGDVLGVLAEMDIKEVRLRDTLLRAAGAGDLLRQSLDMQAVAWRENSALSEESQKRFATTESQLTLLWGRIRDVGVTLGNALLPMIQSTITAVDKLIPVLESGAQWFASLPAPVQATAAGLVAVFAAAGPTLMVLGQMATGASALVGVFGSAGLVGAATGLAAALGPVLLTGAAIGAMVAFDKLEQSTRKTLALAKEGEATFGQTLVAALGNAVSRGVSPFGAAWRDLQEGMEQGRAAWAKVVEFATREFGPAIESVKGLLGSLGEAWGALRDLTGAVAGKIIEYASRIGQGISEWLGVKLRPVLNAVAPLVQGVEQVFGTAHTAIVTFARRIYEGVKTWLVDRFVGIVDGIKGKIDAVTGFFRDMHEKVVGNSYVPDMIKGIRGQFAQLQTVMVQPAHKAVSDTITKFSQLADKILPGFGTIGTAAASMFEKMLTGAVGFKDGFLSIWDSIESGVKRIFSNILNDFTNRLMKGMTDALTGRGGFAQAFSGFLPNLFGGGAGLTNSAGVGSATWNAAAGMPGGAGAAATPWWSTAIGGGLIGGAAGGFAGWMVGGQTGNTWGSAGAGAGTGATVGAILGGPIGAGIGALIGGVAGWYRAKQENIKTNDLRDVEMAKLAEKYGLTGTEGTGLGSTFHNIAARLTEAGHGAGGGQLFQQLVTQNDREGFLKALEAVNQALAEYEQRTKSATDAEQAHSAALEDVRAQHQARIDELKAEEAEVAKQIAEWDAREAPEAVMGAVEAAARAELAQQQQAIQTALQEQQAAMEAALAAATRAATETGGEIGTALDGGFEMGKAAAITFADWLRDQGRLGRFDAVGTIRLTPEVFPLGSIPNIPPVPDIEAKSGHDGEVGQPTSFLAEADTAISVPNLTVTNTLVPRQHVDHSDRSPRRFRWPTFSLIPVPA